ncbi:MAG: hypothetical protein HYX65_11350 [Gemmatimonadetes bacterium]|nr:hypothetical protein [Gemmatimonadota bacterium]
MHWLLRGAYRATGALAEALAALAPRGGGKVARSLRARHVARAGLVAWGRAQREASRPLLWVHAPSVGEGLQARPVLELARAAMPGLQLAYTWFSPSAEGLASTLDADFVGPLPLDTATNARAALDALRPAALVFSKLDVWPVLVAEASARGVRLGLVSATLAEESSRGDRFARALLRDAYAALDAVGAIDEADAARLVAFGVRPDRIAVTGDTRYDQVWARARGIDRGSSLLASLGDTRPTLVAGSTWPADEGPLLGAWDRLLRQAPHGERPRLVIAPHEPTPAHCAAIERWARRAGLGLGAIDSADAGKADVLLVNRVGVLGDLYALATVAYVGGGFHRAGLHSVLEPAAFGVPVVVGPLHRRSRDAMLLLAAGGAAAADNVAGLEAAIGSWLSGDRDAGARAGEAARQVVRRGLGAAARSWGLVAGLLDARG